MKRRLEDLEDRAGASASSSQSQSQPQPQSQASASVPLQVPVVAGGPDSGLRYSTYSPPHEERPDPSKMTGVVGAPPPLRSGVGDTIGRYAPEGGPRPEIGSRKVGRDGEMSI